MNSSCVNIFPYPAAGVAVPARGVVGALRDEVVPRQQVELDPAHRLIRFILCRSVASLL